MDRLKHEGFYIADWHVEPLLHRVSGHGRMAQVEPKLIDVLVYLASNAGRVVTREQIMDEVWSETVVTDHALTRSISELRKVFEDDPKEPSVIETIPKSGYRLVAPVVFPGPSSDGNAVATDQLSLHLPGSPPASRSARRRITIAIALGTLLLAVAAAAGVMWNSSPPATVTPLPLTSLPGRELTPVFSPDGEQVAFVWAREAFETERHIHVKHLESETSVPVTSGPGQHLYPAWSPDGHHIAFLRLTEDACGIFTVSSLGTSERKIADCEMEIRDLVWSPDGTTLALAGRATQAEPRRIYLMDVETLERRTLTDPPSYAYGDDLPVFSPDGTTIAFRRSRAPGINDIYTISLSNPSAGARRRTFDKRTVFGFDWMPSGRELVMSSNRSGLYRLWRVAANGSFTHPEATISAWDPGRPAVSRRGNRMAYVEWFYEVNVWRAPLNASREASPERVVESTRTDYLPSYSPDGERIAFTSDRSGSSEIWVAQRDGSRPVKLTSFGNPTTKGPAWSPDGRHLAFWTMPDGYGQVYILDAEGGTPRPLVADTTDAVAPTWSADGRSIYFGSNRSGDWQIWKVAASGGVPTQMTTTSGYAARESFDGKTLYFTKYTEDGIFGLDMESGHVEAVVPEFEAFNWSAWTVRPEGLYYLLRDRGTGQVHHRGLDGITTLLREIDCVFMEHNSGLSVSPDGSDVLTSCIDRSETDIMLVENFR